MPIKVCHLTSVHKSDDIRVFQKECRSVAKDPRFQVSLLAPGESRTEAGVEVIGLGPPPSSRLKRIFFFTRFLYRKAREIDADIYHFHDPELLPIGLKLKALGKVVVYDSHELTYQQILIKDYLPKAVRTMISGLFKAYEDRACQKLDAVIFPCTIKGKHPFQAVAKNCLTIGNFPDLDLYRPELDQEKSYDLCCTGSLSEARGISSLLEARQATGASLALAGNFSPASYEQELDQAGLLQGVDHIGFLSHSAVIDLVKKSRICVSNILDLGQYGQIDNLPTKVYEAMALGLPVILSAFDYACALNEELEFCILIDPARETDLVEAIRDLLADPEKRSRLGENGRALVTKNFSWAKEATKLKDLYVKLLADQTPAKQEVS